MYAHTNKSLFLTALQDFIFLNFSIFHKICMKFLCIKINSVNDQISTRASSNFYYVNEFAHVRLIRCISNYYTSPHTFPGMDI